jgi:hypothetical protein
MSHSPGISQSTMSNVLKIATPIAVCAGGYPDAAAPGIGQASQSSKFSTQSQQILPEQAQDQQPVPNATPPALKQANWWDAYPDAGNNPASQAPAASQSDNPWYSNPISDTKDEVGAGMSDGHEAVGPTWVIAG